MAVVDSLECLVHQFLRVVSYHNQESPKMQPNRQLLAFLVLPKMFLHRVCTRLNRSLHHLQEMPPELKRQPLKVPQHQQRASLLVCPVPSRMRTRRCTTVSTNSTWVNNIKILVTIMVMVNLEVLLHKEVSGTSKSWGKIKGMAARTMMIILTNKILTTLVVLVDIRKTVAEDIVVETIIMETTNIKTNTTLNNTEDTVANRTGWDTMATSLTNVEGTQVVWEIHMECNKETAVTINLEDSMMMTTKKGRKEDAETILFNKEPPNNLVSNLSVFKAKVDKVPNLQLLEAAEAGPTKVVAVVGAVAPQVGNKTANTTQHDAYVKINCAKAS